METQQTKKCSRCKQEQPVIEFYQNSSKKDGLSHWCRSCNKTTQKAYRAANLEKVNAQAQKYYREHPFSHLLTDIKCRAKRKQLDFNLDLEYLNSIKVQYCPILKFELSYEPNPQSKRLQNKATLDRIDNSKGYTKDNVAFISWKANRLKCNLTAIQLTKLAEYAGGGLHV